MAPYKRSIHCNVSGSPFTICQHIKHAETEFLFLSLFCYDQNLQKTQEHRRTQTLISINGDEFEAVLRDSLKNLHHRTLASAIRSSSSSPRWQTWTITESEASRVRRREDRSEFWTSEAERERITDLFSVQDLPEASQDLIVRISKQNQVNIQILLVLASNHHRRIKSEVKRWIEVKTSKRFEKVETKP